MRKGKGIMWDNLGKSPIFIIFIMCFLFSLFTFLSFRILTRRLSGIKDDEASLFYKSLRCLRPFQVEVTFDYCIKKEREKKNIK
jgi:hypothetical protein